MDNIEKKEITERTAIKAFINGFVSYGLILGFITLIATAFFKWIARKFNSKSRF